MRQRRERWTARRRRRAEGLLPREGSRTVIDHRRPGPPAAAICSLATGRHRELLALSCPTFDAFARANGWTLVLSSEDLAPSRPPSWSKVKLAQELVVEYEYVFWVDADAIIVNPERNVLDEVDSEADAWFAHHTQEQDPEASVLNAGVFLVRASPFSRSLLDAMWRSEHLVDHNWWENAALLELLGYSLEFPYSQLRTTAWQERIGSLDLAWNNVPGYCETADPAINHHARSDHDDFARRVADVRGDLERTRLRYPHLFAINAPTR